jgi:hypothetical protein
MTTNYNSAPPPAGATHSPGTAPAPARNLDSLALWVMGGGAGVFLGSLLPFVTVNLDGFFSVNVISPGARVLSALFGLVLVALGAVMRFGPPDLRRGVSIAALAGGAAGTLGYAGFMLLGLHGISEGGSLGLPVQITYSPSIGIILALAGCIAAAVAALNTVRSFIRPAA